MTIATPADYIQVPGRVDILIALPSAYSSLFKVGESENGVRVRIMTHMGDVIGDRHGGAEGPPIEKQFFGKTADFELAMSRWDPAQLVKLEKYGGLLTSAGTIPLAAIGALLLRDRGTRVLLHCNRDTTLSLNFPCCIWDQPLMRNKGTKYETPVMGVSAHRAPEGFWNSGSEGILYDADLTGTT